MNVVTINNSSLTEWFVTDSKMRELEKKLNEIGIKTSAIKEKPKKKGGR